MRPPSLIGLGVCTCTVFCWFVKEDDTAQIWQHCNHSMHGVSSYYASRTHRACHKIFSHKNDYRILMNHKNSKNILGQIGWSEIRSGPTLLNALYPITVKVLSTGMDRSEQTVQTQIRLLLMEQSDQGLHCLLFHPTHTCDKFQRGIREVFLSFPGGF